MINKKKVEQETLELFGKYKDEVELKDVCFYFHQEDLEDQSVIIDFVYRNKKYRIEVYSDNFHLLENDDDYGPTSEGFASSIESAIDMYIEERG